MRNTEVVAWTFVRPSDPAVLAGRPLLDLGTGDGQTLEALAPEGFTVGVDRTLSLLRRGGVNAAVGQLPFRDGSFATVLAADLFHHLDDAELASVLSEVRRVVAPGGQLVAWWYEQASDRSPDAPRYARSLEAFVQTASRVDLVVRPLDVTTTVAESPTVAIAATR